MGELIGAIVFGAIALVALFTGSNKPSRSDLGEERGYSVVGVNLPDGRDIDGDGAPNDLHWEHVPIRLIYHPSFRTMVPALVEATKIRPQLFGRPIEATVLEQNIEIGIRPPRGTIYLTTDIDGVDPRHGSTTLWSLPDGEILAAVVVIPEECPQHLIQSVVLHEILHALGFSHSRDRDSVMYPVSKGKTRLTESELKLLEKI
jgi:hypothetical protein